MQDLLRARAFLNKKKVCHILYNNLLSRRRQETDFNGNSTLSLSLPIFIVR